MFWISPLTLNEVSHHMKYRSGNLIYSKTPVIYGTQNIPQGVQTLPSELDWNISAARHTRTPSSIQHAHPTPPTPPPSVHPFTHSSPYIHALCHLTSPTRLFLWVRKQLMELSSAKKLHHLLYPLSVDSLV